MKQTRRCRSSDFHRTVHCIHMFPRGSSMTWCVGVQLDISRYWQLDMHMGPPVDAMVDAQFCDFRPRSEAEIRWRTRTARKEVWEFESSDRNGAQPFCCVARSTLLCRSKHLLCSSKRAASARPMPYILVDPDRRQHVLATHGHSHHRSTFLRRRCCPPTCQRHRHLPQLRQ